MKVNVSTGKKRFFIIKYAAQNGAPFRLERGTAACWERGPIQPPARNSVVFSETCPTALRSAWK